MQGIHLTPTRNNWKLERGAPRQYRRRPPFAFISHSREVPMRHAKQGKPMSQFSISNPFGEIFAHNANLWFATHAELLANVDALTHAWLSRRREGVDAMREAIQEMTECQDPADMLRIQPDW